MPLDNEAKRIKAWARNGDRLLPTSTELDPVLARATGWVGSFSNTGGNTPRRPLLNELECELTAVMEEFMCKGVVEHHEDIPYNQYGIVQRDGLLYFKKAAGSGAWVANEWTLIARTQRAPSAPQNLTISLDRRTATLDWDAPADLGGLPLIRYRVQRATNADFTADAVSANTLPADTELTSPNLTVGRMYFYRVFAENARGESVASNVVNVAVVAVTPTAPQNFAVMPHISQTVRATWDAPSDDGGSAIVCYDIEWKSGAQAFSSARRLTVGGAVRQADLGGLTNGVSHDFRISAVNGVGRSAWSDTESATPAAGVPGKVSNISLSAGSGTITATATAPATGGSAITGYRFGYKRTGVNENFTFENSDDNVHTFTGLQLNTGYDVVAQARNNVGLGPQSNVFTVSTTGNAVNLPAWSANMELTPNQTNAQSFDAPVATGGDGTNYVYTHGVLPTGVTFDSANHEFDVSITTANTAYSTVYDGTERDVEDNFNHGTFTTFTFTATSGGASRTITARINFLGVPTLSRSRQTGTTWVAVWANHGNLNEQIAYEDVSSAIVPSGMAWSASNVSGNLQVELTGIPTDPSNTLTAAQFFDSGGQLITGTTILIIN